MEKTVFRFASDTCSSVATRLFAISGKRPHSKTRLAGFSVKIGNDKSRVQPDASDAGK